MVECKGIDDLLAAGRKPRRLRGAEVESFFAGVRAQLFAPPPDARGVPTAAAGVALDDRPIFPLSAFPEKVARFARRVAAAMGCPLDFLGLAILVVSGSVIGAARSLKVKAGWYEKPGMYAVIVSRPGTIKTAALRAVMQPIYDEQDRLYENHKAALKKYKEDLEEYRRASKGRGQGEPAPKPPEEPPPMRHLFAGDSTVEALASNLKDNRKGILIFRDELTAWVRSMDMYRGRGGDRQLYLSGWSGEMVKVDRKGQHGSPIVIPHPFVSVLGGIQPDLLGELEAEGGREDGFIHRLLFSYPREQEVKGWIEDEITEHDEEEWQRILCRLLNLQPVKPEGSSERPKRLQFSPDGKEAFKAWCNQLAARMNDEDLPGEMVGPGSKLRAYCARFALVLHLLRVACADDEGNNQDEGRVDAEDVTGAIKLCEYFEAHYRAVHLRLQQTKEDRQVEDLIRWLRRKGKSGCTVREICRAGVCGISRSSDAQKLLTAAVDQGLGDWQGGPLKGGPAVRKIQHARETPAFVLRGQG
jgi:hypothetical protein